MGSYALAETTRTVRPSSRSFTGTSGDTNAYPRDEANSLFFRETIASMLGAESIDEINKVVEIILNEDKDGFRKLFHEAKRGSRK